jgi:hypothetical protein
MPVQRRCGVIADRARVTDPPPIRRTARARNVWPQQVPWIEVREDTVLFPKLNPAVSASEYDAMAEEFEDKEHELFGDDGFDKMVHRVATIEQILGIWNLSQFTVR